jgi:spermidine/putrescine transport system permease protein
MIDTQPASARMRTGRISRLLYKHEVLRGYALLTPAMVVMGLAVLVPFAMLIVLSFWTQVGFGYDSTPTLANYQKVYEKPIYLALMERSLWISGTATIATVVLSYPMAYYVAFHVHRHKMIWIILITLPFWTSYLLRVFAWKVILGYEGVINSGLLHLGLIEDPLRFLLYSQTAVSITLAHAWAAFAILPIYVSLEKIDKSYLEASADLGDGPALRFLRITLPLSMPGVISAVFLMFIPTLGDYVTPAMVGGPDSTMIGNLIQLQFGSVNNWPMGSALSMILVLTICVLGLSFWGLTRLFRRWAA